MKILLLVQSLSILGTALSACSLYSSVYVSGADDHFVGESETLDGCYTILPSTFDVGLICRNGAYADGPCFVPYEATGGTGWALTPYTSTTTDTGSTRLSAIGDSWMWSNEDETPADVQVWGDGVVFFEDGIVTEVPETVCVTCGCTTVPQCSPIPTPGPVSPTPEPVSPTPEPVSPTPEPVSPTPVSPTPVSPTPVSPTPVTDDDSDDAITRGEDDDPLISGTSTGADSGSSSTSTGAIVGGSVAGVSLLAIIIGCLVKNRKKCKKLVAKKKNSGNKTGGTTEVNVEVGDVEIDV